MDKTLLVKEFEYFIYVAEELNITKAAKKAFVSQQAMSKYIKNLEDLYKVELFTRKPTLKLTLAGELFLKRAYQIRQLSESLSEEISGIQQGVVGQIRFGVSYGRAFLSVPALVEDLRSIYPNVKLNVSLTNTSVNIDKLIKNELDVALGVSPEPNKNLIYETIATESIFLALTDDMLKRYFPDDYPNCKYRFKNGVNLKEFEHVPFVFNSNVKHVRELIKTTIEEERVNLNFTVDTGSNELNLNLCNSVACFCLQFLLPYVRSYNELNPSNPINVFPINALRECNEIKIMYPKDTNKQVFIEYFIQLVKDTIYEQMNIYGSTVGGKAQSSYILPLVK